MIKLFNIASSTNNYATRFDENISKPKSLGSCLGRTVSFHEEKNLSQL